MIIRTEVLTTIELTSLEVAMLTDLLQGAHDAAEQHGSAWEQLRRDLLYGLPSPKA